MGTDKALLAVDGTPMAVRVTDALRTAGARPVIAVGGDAVGLEAVGLDPVADLDPGAGPLGGILTALLALAPREVVFVASCDLVAPAPAAVAATVGALARGSAPAGGRAGPLVDVAVPLVGGRRQWMHAAWRSSTAPALRGAFDAGERAVHAACAMAGLNVVDLDLPPAAVADADTPSELPHR